MRIAVLAATGPTGRLLVTHALDRGHQVIALARDPGPLPARPELTPVTVDVLDPGTVAAALDGIDVLVSGLGGPVGVLTAGARAVAGLTPVVWLGAFGTGRSAGPAGPLTRGVLRLALGREIPDKVAADEILLAAGATVLHAGPLTDGRLSPTRRTVPLAEMPRRILPPPVSRATVAAAMLDVAEDPRRTAGILVPLG
ncbi:NAD(P)-dependent oxidoreductase [Micromonosporaceae bacterium Da 78-11]